MIVWDKHAYNEYGVLQVKDEELEAFAYAQLRDYKKDFFKTVHALDVDDFVENYLKINVQFQRLSPNNSRYGMTAISSGVVPIMNEENKPDLRYFQKGTICVDLDACNNDNHIIGFTLIHESGHSQFDLYVNKSLLDGETYINDEKLLDGKNLIVKRRTQKDWMEYHANKYASYILMPAQFVRKLYKQKHDEIMPGQRLGVRQRKLIWKMIYAVAEELNVSSTAMAWRFLTLGIISQQLFDALEINHKKEETAMK